CTLVDARDHTGPADVIDRVEEQLERVGRAQTRAHRAGVGEPVDAALPRVVRRAGDDGDLGRTGLLRVGEDALDLRERELGADVERDRLAVAAEIAERVDALRGTVALSADDDLAGR